MEISKTTSYTWNLFKYICENGNYLISIIDNSAAACNEIIEETKIIPPEKIFQQILTRKRDGLIYEKILVYDTS